MRASHLSLVASLLVVSTADAQPAGLFLGVRPVDNPSNLRLVPGATRVRLVFLPEATARAQELLERFPSAAEENGALVLEVSRYSPRRGDPAPGDLAATFLVDFDEPVFADIRQAVVARLGERPTPEQLRVFVRGHIQRKDLSRGFDLASQTALSRQGDCSEHAVLLVALARLFGWPARMITGLALLQEKGTTVSAGHAWAEIHDGSVWQAFDATDLPSETLRIPLATIHNEDPGYAFAMLQLLSPLHVAKVTLLSPGLVPGRGE